MESLDAYNLGQALLKPILGLQNVCHGVSGKVTRGATFKFLTLLVWWLSNWQEDSFAWEKAILGFGPGKTFSGDGFWCLG